MKGNCEENTIWGVIRLILESFSVRVTRRLKKKTNHREVRRDFGEDSIQF